MELVFCDCSFVMIFQIESAQYSFSPGTLCTSTPLDSPRSIWIFPAIYFSERAKWEIKQSQVEGSHLPYRK